MFRFMKIQKIFHHGKEKGAADSGLNQAQKAYMTQLTEGIFKQFSDQLSDIRQSLSSSQSFNSSEESRRVRGLTRGQ